MKKLISLALAFTLSAGALCATACSTSNGGNNGEQNGAEAPLPEYTVSATSGAGGKLTASKEKVQFGESVTFTAVPENGYLLALFEINGNEVEMDGNSYVISGAMRNYAAKAYFVQSNVTITFDEGEENAPDSKQAVYGGKYGKLPVPAARKGKRFTGWLDSAGNKITENSKVDGASSVIGLVSSWEELDETQKAQLKPISISTTYHDMAATKYGVVWHTRAEPLYPVIYVSKGGSVDESTARVIRAESEFWFRDEYVINGVVDNLEYETQYTVKMGDLAADVWSREYTFITREEKLEDANFIFIADTQENRLIENMGTLSYGGSQDWYLGTTYSSQVLKEARAHFPEADFIAHGGDIINYGIEARYWEQMLGSWDENLFSLPMAAIAGNHEDPMWYAFGRKNNIVNKMFNVDWSEDAYASAGMFYSFDYGPLHFVALRSNDVYNDENGMLGEGQLEWLKQDVTAAKQREEIKWVVAMMHEGPIYPDFTRITSNAHEPMLGGQLLPVFDELDLDLLLCGHGHDLNTSYPIVWDETAAPQKNTDNPEKRFPGQANAKEITVSAVTRQTKKVTLADGTQVDEFVYPAGTTNRGTVYHQVPTSGMQVSAQYKYTQVKELLAEKTIYKALASCAAGCIEVDGKPSEVPYSAYSYLEVKKDTLTMRTYGVDAKGVYKETDSAKYKNYSVFIDGIRLLK